MARDHPPGRLYARGNLAIDTPLPGMVINLCDHETDWAPVNVYRRAEIVPYRPSNHAPSPVFAYRDDPGILVFSVRQGNGPMPIGLCVGIALASLGIVVTLGTVPEPEYGVPGGHFAEIGVARAREAIALHDRGTAIASWRIISGGCQPQWVAPTRELCGALNIPPVREMPC